MLQRGLIVDLGYRFGPIARGSKHMIGQSVIETWLRIRAPKQDWTLIRRNRKAS